MYFSPDGSTVCPLVSAGVDSDQSMTTVTTNAPRLILNSMNVSQGIIEARDEEGIITPIGYQRPELRVTMTESHFGGTGFNTQIQTGRQITVAGYRGYITNVETTVSNNDFVRHSITVSGCELLEGDTSSGEEVRDIVVSKQRIKDMAVLKEILEEKGAPIRKKLSRRIRLRSTH